MDEESDDQQNNEMVMKNINDKRDPVGRFIPRFQKTYQDVNYRKKFVTIINNLIYKRIVSNYRMLLDEELDNDQLDTLIYSTVTTLEISLNEIIKM